MSGRCPTLDSLIALGFERQRPESGDILCYRFASLELVAMHPDITGRGAMAGVPSALRPTFSGEYLETMNQYKGYVVWLTGTPVTPRTVSEIQNPLPPDLSSAPEAAAWVSYVLRSHRSDLGPLPDWFVEGERHWDLVPPARRARTREEESRERKEWWQAYQASPRCSIDRDYALLLRRNLRKAVAELAGDAEMTFRFDGRVLSIALHGHVKEVATPRIAGSREHRRIAVASGEYVQEVVASGDTWPSSYRVVVSPETTLPARFPYSTVDLRVFEGYVQLEGHPLGPYEEVVWNLRPDGEPLPPTH